VDTARPQRVVRWAQINKHLETGEAISLPDACLPVGDDAN